MKYIISLIVIFSLKFGSCYGQLNLTPTNEWTAVSENDLIKVAYIYEECRIPSQGLEAEYIYLSIENKSKKTISVSWFNDTYYNGTCTNCDHTSRDRKRTIVLEPKQTQTGECKVGLNEGLRIHRKFLNLPKEPVLQKLVVTELTATEISKK